MSVDIMKPLLILVFISTSINCELVNPIIESEAQFHNEQGSQVISNLKRSRREFYSVDLQQTLDVLFLPQSIDVHFVATVIFFTQAIVGFALAGISITLLFRVLFVTIDQYGVRVLTLVHTKVKSCL